MIESLKPKYLFNCWVYIPDAYYYSSDTSQAI